MHEDQGNSCQYPSNEFWSIYQFTKIKTRTKKSLQIWIQANVEEAFWLAGLFLDSQYQLCQLDHFEFYPYQLRQKEKKTLDWSCCFLMFIPVWKGGKAESQCDWKVILPNFCDDNHKTVCERNRLWKKLFFYQHLNARKHNSLKHRITLVCSSLLNINSKKYNWSKVHQASHPPPPPPPPPLTRA